MKEKKSGLIKTTELCLKLIEKGDDFSVDKLEEGGMFIKIPYLKHDVEPHIEDFLKAGVEKQDIAFYFAYIATLKEYYVYSKLMKGYLSVDERPSSFDHQKMSEIEEEFLDSVLFISNERKNKFKTKNEEETM